MKTINELNRERVVKRWAKIHELEKKFIADNSADVLPLKARIHGYLCGDGSVSMRIEKGNKKLHADIRFYPDDYSLIPPFLEALKKVYNKKATIKREKNHYRVFLTSKTIALDLLNDSSFDSTTWYIPAWITTNEDRLREWLRAYYDAEAYVGKREIRVQTVNKDGAHSLQKNLKKFNIVSKIYRYKRKQMNWNDNFHIIISTSENRKQFLKEIGFNHIFKLRKLKDIVNTS